jgi:RNA polymerase sigma-70 factor (ECF subfamily)
MRAWPDAWTLRTSSRKPTWKRSNDSSANFVSGLVGRLPTPSQELAKAELAEQLRQGLERLSSEERDLILWRHFEQLRARDIAQLIGITEAAANKRYLRAVEHLKRILQEQGISKHLR